VIFTNLSGVSSGNRDVKSLTGKISDIAAQLSIPLIALMALEHDKYRKPSTGMAGLLMMLLNNPNDKKGSLKAAEAAEAAKAAKAAEAVEAVEAAESVESLESVESIDCFDIQRFTSSFEEFFYCGDAAGREKSWDGNKKTKKDFSCSDRKFAANIGVRFFTPEEFFLKKAPSEKWKWGSMNSQAIIERFGNNLLPDVPVFPESKEQEMILMIGSPASGKTSFSKRHFPSYTRASNDESGTKKKALTIAKLAFRNGKSVVVDNTNPSVSDRSLWIDLARDAGVKIIRAVWMDTEREIAEHMNIFRETKSERTRVPTIVFNIFFKRFTEPTKEEGITEIYRVPFSLNLDEMDEKTKRIFSLWI
jgi:predicted kinase